MKLKAILTLIDSILFLAACSSQSSLPADNFAGNNNLTISEFLASNDTKKPLVARLIVLIKTM